MLFPIDGDLEPILYLSRFPRYLMANVTQWSSASSTLKVLTLKP